MTDDFLQVAVDEAIARIKKGYELAEGKIYLSFSGGKDSTVVAELIKMAELPELIPFVFADTKIELDATTKFVNEFPYDKKVILSPRKPFGQILKEYGKPAISKNKSEWLSTYQNHLDDPLKTARARQLISGQVERGGELRGFVSKNRLANKHFHILHPDLEYNISNKCCQYMKKYPFQDYEKESGNVGTFTGIRVAEGGARAMAYKTCTIFRKKGGKDNMMVMPIFDWSDELLEEFITAYAIKLSDAYEVYGYERTGCIGCPFSKTLEKDLTSLAHYEPKKYKATIKWLGDVYIDQDVKLEFDEDYMERYEARNAVNEDRREEMLERFKDIREVKRKKHIQLELDI